MGGYSPIAGGRKLTSFGRVAPGCSPQPPKSRAPSKKPDPSIVASNFSVGFGKIKHALRRTYADVVENHTMQMAAALSYYFVLSLFPALIFLSAIVAYLPVPDLFNQTLALMARFLPADTMGLVRRVLADVITPNRGTFLSFGILGALWAASGVLRSHRGIEYCLRSQR